MFLVVSISCVVYRANSIVKAEPDIYVSMFVIFMYVHTYVYREYMIIYHGAVSAYILSCSFLSVCACSESYLIIAYVILIT